MISYQFALTQFEIFSLILIRLASFVYAAPFFNMANTPHRVKIGFSFVMTILVYFLSGTTFKLEYEGVLGYAILVLEEVVVGLILGTITQFCVLIINFAGKIIDMDIGLSMAQIYDPTMKTDMGIMGNFYYYLLMILLIISGMHKYLVSAIVETYNAIPLGGINLTGNLYEIIIDFMSDYFIIGFRIALPVFAVTLMLNCILAILAKIAPQMNMFVVGMQLKIFAGIFAILFTIGMLPAVAGFIMELIESLFASIVRAIGGA